MKRFITLILAVLLISCCFTGCGDSSGDGGSSEAQTLNMAIPAFPDTLDPHQFSTAWQYCICRNIYEPMVYLTDDNEEIFLLAESYDVSDDGKEYTFHLRQDVKFHNGETMTADDVVYSVERAMKDPYMSTYVSAVDSVSKTDDSTVVISLKAPSASFIRNQKYYAIVSQKFAEENESLATVACGTGPYQLTGFNDGADITLTAFADYWQGTPGTDTVVYNYISDSATQMISFESGDLTYLEVPTAEWERISQDDTYKSGKTTQDMVYWLVFNTEVEPLNNEKVRQAVYCAINKEDVLLTAGDGVGTIANVMADPRIINGATDDFDYLEYDPDRAKELLAEAGYPDGVDIGEVIYRGGTKYEKIAAACQSSLAEVGITVTMKSVDPSAIFDYVCAGDFNVCAFSSALGRDYSLYSQLYTTPYLDVLDLCRLQDPEVDAKFEQAATTMDDEERNAIYKDLIEQLELGAYYVPLYYDDYLWACDPAFEPHIDDGGLWIYYSTWE